MPAPKKRPKQQQQQQPVLLDKRQVAEMFGISDRGVIRLHESGELPSVKVGKLRRYRLADVEKYVANLETADF